MEHFTTYTSNFTKFVIRKGQVSTEKYWVERGWGWGLRILSSYATLKFMSVALTKAKKKQVSYTRNTVEQYRPIDSGTRTLADRN